MPMRIVAKPKRLYGCAVRWYGKKRNQFGSFSVMTVISVPFSQKIVPAIIIK